METTMTVKLDDESLVRLGEIIAEKIVFAKNRPEPWITIEELAEKTGRGRGTIYHDIQRTDIPCMRSGRRVRFKLSEVEKWLRDNKK